MLMCSRLYSYSSSRETNVPFIKTKIKKQNKEFYAEVRESNFSRCEEGRK